MLKLRILNLSAQNQSHFLYFVNQKLSGPKVHIRSNQNSLLVWLLFNQRCNVEGQLFYEVYKSWDRYFTLYNWLAATKVYFQHACVVVCYLFFRLITHYNISDCTSLYFFYFPKDIYKILVLALVMLDNIKNVSIQLRYIPIHLLEAYLAIRLINLNPIPVSWNDQLLHLLAYFIHFSNLFVCL